MWTQSHILQQLSKTRFYPNKEVNVWHKQRADNKCGTRIRLTVWHISHFHRNVGVEETGDNFPQSWKVCSSPSLIFLRKMKPHNKWFHVCITFVTRAHLVQSVQIGEFRSANHSGLLSSTRLWPFSVKNQSVSDIREQNGSRTVPWLNQPTSEW